MDLGLDLSESRDKLARASQYLHALNAEAEIATEKIGPYKARLGKQDTKTGWCPVFVTCAVVPNDVQQRITTLVGDAVHNIRCALDYIATSLAETSKTSNARTQFPIFKDPADYGKRIWNKGETVGRGQLGGVKFGLAEIEALQPYNAQPDFKNSPIWQIQRFSNYDKHRKRSVALSFPRDEAPFSVEFGGCPQPINSRRFFPKNFGPDKEMKILEVRFRSCPQNPDIKIHMTTDFMIGVGSTPAEREWFAMTSGSFHLARKFVYQVVERFEHL